MVDDIDILHKEIQSWDKFKCALRKENAVLFDQMLKECLEEDKEGRQVQFANVMNARKKFCSRILVYGLDITATKNDKSAN